MSLFAVTRVAGPSWTDGKGAFEQPAVNDHAAFMNNLADEGFVLFAGPLAGSERDRIRVLLIAEAESETDIRRRLADDPLGTYTTIDDDERRAVEPSRRRRPLRRPARGSVSHHQICLRVVALLGRRRISSAWRTNLRQSYRTRTQRTADRW